jgi:recombination associated protein RdgC
MWFKNLNLYRLAGSFELSAEALHEQLEPRAFRPCGSMDMASLGWVAPLGHLGEQLTHQSNGCIMVCLRKEEKVLPTAVVREIVNDKVLEIETEQMRRVARKEKESIRDEVLQDLLPRAFTRSKLTHAYIDPRQGWVLVDNPTASKAEELISMLRESLGSFPVRPLAVQHSPAAMMTAWVDGSAQADGFEVQDECELRDSGEDGGIVRCRRQDLSSDEIQGHLRAGKQVVRLAVEWNERLSCVLGDDLIVRRLRFGDVLQEEAADAGADDAVARFDADFALMSLELGRFIPAVLDAFGGEEQLERAA